eukprot:SRR837773.7068.p1 GENE.SRR837773.7068~~SRR837773.7068.p1  ORF type:complete len:222 (+),score=42.92 SRR837773.7068:55-720(+)
MKLCHGRGAFSRVVTLSLVTASLAASKNESHQGEAGGSAAVVDFNNFVSEGSGVQGSQAASELSILQKSAKVEEQDASHASKFEYTATEKLADSLAKVATTLDSDIQSARQSTDQTLTSNAALNTMVDNMFGDKVNVHGLKSLDKQAHQLRGHLQQKHQWMTGVLEHIIADYQDTPADKTFVAHKSKDYKPADAERTGLEAAAWKPQEAGPWKLTIGPHES